MTARVRVQIPYHLQTLAHCEKELELVVNETVSVASIVQALVARYPMLSGTVLDHYSGQRQAKIRFFACGEDVSLLPIETELPHDIAIGSEPLMIVGAISGG